MIPEQTLRTALASVTGEPAVLAKDLAWDLRRPCADCPFMKTSEFHEGVAKGLPSLMMALQDNRGGHSCHKTDTRPGCDGPVRGQETGRPIQSCAGFTMMILKTGRGFDLQLPLLEAMQEGKLTSDDVAAMRDQARADKNIFTVPQLLRFYEEGCEDFIAREKADV